MQFLEAIGGWFTEVPALGTLAAVLAIVLVGSFVCYVVGHLVRRAIRRLDKRGAASAFFFGESLGQNRLAVVASKIVFWGGMLFVAMAVFEKLEVSAVSEPLQTLFGGVAFGVPAILKAAIILVVAWVGATVARSLVEKGWTKFRIDQKILQIASDSAESVVVPRSKVAGSVVFFVVWCLALPAALNALGIHVLGNAMGVMWSDVLGFLPRLVAASLIFVVGYVAAKVLKGAVTRMLEATNIDAKVARWLPNAVFSSFAGTVLFFLIMIPAGIAALEAIGIPAISQPLNNMVAMILAFVPKLAVSVLILGVFALVGKITQKGVSGVLHGLGADEWPLKLGFRGIEKSPISASRAIGLLAGGVVVLLGLSQATMTLELNAFQALVSGTLAFLPNALVAGVILIAGFYFGEMLRAFVARKNETQLAALAKVTVVAFAGVAAADQIGVAERFALIGFSIVMASVGLGAALAFGLGSREVAGDYVRKNFDLPAGHVGAAKEPRGQQGTRPAA